MLLVTALAAQLSGGPGYCDGPRCTDAAWANPEVSTTLGYTASGYTYQGGGVAQSFLWGGINARYRTQLGNALDTFVFDVGNAGIVPLIPDAAGPGTVWLARVGLGFRRVAFAVGVRARIDAAPASTLVLPSLTLTVRPGALAFTLGVLDQLVGPLARLTVEYGSFGLGFAAPLGAEAFARFRVHRYVAMEVRGFGYQLFNSYSFGLSFAVVLGGGTTWRFGGGR